MHVTLKAGVNVLPTNGSLVSFAAVFWDDIPKKRLRSRLTARVPSFFSYHILKPSQCNLLLHMQTHSNMTSICQLKRAFM